MNKTKTITFDQMKRITDKRKKSKVNEGPGAGYTVEMTDITLLNATATVADGAWKVKGDCRFIGHAQGYDWSTEELEYEGQFEFDVNTHQINRYVEKYLPEWDPESVTEEDIKEMLERTSAYSIEDISQMIGAGWIHVKWDGVLEVDQAGFDLDDRYLSGHDAEVGNFEIQLYDKGTAPEGDCNNCYFSIEAHDDFALDVETAYQDKDYDGEDEVEEAVVKESEIDDAEGEFLDDWLMPEQLTDEEFEDFCTFVDGYTGTEDYSNYRKKMPRDVFDEVYEKWLTLWEKKHPEQKPEGGWYKRGLPKVKKDEDPLVENSRGLIDQVLENPEVRAAAERFVNCFIEDVAYYEEFDNKLADYITTGDELRFKKLKEAIRNAMNNYKGPK